MIRDPYKTLNLPRDATASDIKRAYRTLSLQLHPDRNRDTNSNDNSSNSNSNDETCTRDFAQVAEAYALLSDSKRKADYDHIYKYGGYDHAVVEEEKKEEAHFDRNRRASSADFSDNNNNNNNAEESMGIGYSCHDPFLSFLFTQGKVQSTRTVAGIQIPKRFDFQNGRRGSFRVAISSGQRFSRDPHTGTQAFRSQTTHFTEGYKFTRSETVVVHPDGRKEGVVVDNINNSSCSTRRYVIDPPAVAPMPMQQEQSDHKSSSSSSSPWYVTVWGEVKNSLTMCHG